MNSINTFKLMLSPLWLRSDSSIQIPQSSNRYNSMLPSVYISSLKLHTGPKGGPGGHVPPRRDHECPKKKIMH